MYNIVKIGEKEVPMLSKASVDFFYYNIFHEDPIKLQVNQNSDIGTMFVFMQKMAFVMAKFAEVKDTDEMSKVGEKSFYDWIGQFERNDLTLALEDIQKTYEGQALTGSVAKKNSEQPTDQ